MFWVILTHSNSKVLRFLGEKHADVFQIYTLETHDILTPHLMSTKGIREIIEERFINTIRKGISHNNYLISNILIIKIY